MVPPLALMSVIRNSLAGLGWLSQNCRGAWCGARGELTRVPWCYTAWYVASTYLPRLQHCLRKTEQYF